jgi:hypothetical protein
MNMNFYRHQFSAACPVNGDPIAYALSIASGGVVIAEDIVSFCQGLSVGLHEELADQLWSRFGGRQTLTAHHRGVDIETVRSGEE